MFHRLISHGINICFELEENPEWFSFVSAPYSFSHFTFCINQTAPSHHLKVTMLIYAKFQAVRSSVLAIQGFWRKEGQTKLSFVYKCLCWHREDSLQKAIRPVQIAVWWGSWCRIQWCTEQTGHGVNWIISYKGRLAMQTQYAAVWPI